MQIAGVPHVNPLSYAGPKVNLVPIRVFLREPTTTDVDYRIGYTVIIGKDAVSGTQGDWWFLAKFNSSGEAQWRKISGISAITTDDGAPAVLADSTGNVNLLGSTTVSVTGQGPGNTATVGASVSGFPITPFVVGSIGTAGYQTIQSALDAAKTAGGEMVWIQEGTFVEDLVLYDNINIHGVLGQTTITGVHTPPASGSIEIQDCILTSATDILNSAAAGTTDIEFQNCFFIVTNGYEFNLLNWTGTLLLDNCGQGGTEDGCVNNTGGAPIKFLNTEVGAGTKTMVLTGNADVRFDTMNINVPITIGGSGALIIQNGCKFGNTVTVGGSKVGPIINSSFITGANAAFVMSSSGAISIAGCSVDSSNSPAIDGAGAGVLSLVGIDYLDNAEVASTLTLGTTETSSTPIEVVSQNLTVGRPSQDISFVINGTSVNALLAVHAEGASDLGGFTDQRHSDTALIGTHAIFLRSRGTADTPTIVQDNDLLFRFVGSGYNGTDYSQCAEMRGEVDGTPGNNDMPGRLIFCTSPDGTEVPIEALRIDSSQEVTLVNPLSETNGGTNQTTYTTGDMLYSDAANSIAKLGIGAAGEVLGIAAGVPSWVSNTPTGGVVSYQETSITTAFLITAVTPLDNTIPQIGEGTEIITLAITPTDVSNILRIEFNSYVNFPSTNAATATIALFQDATANALSAQNITPTSSTKMGSPATLVYSMTAGTVSSTTFRIRAGRSAGANLKYGLNANDAGGAQYGGVSLITVNITEYQG